MADPNRALPRPPQRVEVAAAEGIGTPVAAQVVHDGRLGDLLFPQSDQVMAPWIAKNGSWEVGEGWWLDHVLRSGMTFLNVGANVGYFVVWAAALAGPDGRVIAVEPDPGNYALLQENVRRRRLATVTTYRTAASDSTGTLELFLNPRNSGDHRVFDPQTVGPDGALGFEPGALRRIEVPALPADELVGQQQVDVIMTDTQGWDHHVLRGLRRTIDRCRPVVLCEFTPAWIRALGEDPHDVLAEFVDWGYAVGIASIGLPAGCWDSRQVVDYCSLPGLPYATVELAPLDVPKPPRATPGQGFWRPESAGGPRQWWLTRDSGLIHVQGPADALVEVTFQLLAPPVMPATVIVAGASHQVQPRRPVELRVPVRLDGTGLADIELTPTSGWAKVPGDPRRLFTAVVEPVVTGSSMPA